MRRASLGEFVRVWNDSDSPAEAAERLGYANARSAGARASALRREGYRLKRYRQPQEQQSLPERDVTPVDPRHVGRGMIPNLIWMAGYFDARGSIVTRHNATGQELPRVSVSGPAEALAEFQQRLGGTIRPVGSGSNSQRLEWTSRGDIQYVLASLLGYLRVKRSEAEEML